MARSDGAANGQLRFRGGMGGMGGGMGGMSSGKYMNDMMERSKKAEMPGGEALGEEQVRRKAGLEDGRNYFGMTALAAEGKSPDRQDPLPPRERFVETAYWNPSVVTDEQGKARLTFRAPTALSRYEFTARGVTGADTLVGQSSAELVVRKDFFVDLKVPAALAQGDRPRFQARVHHTGATGAVALRLSVYAGGRESVYPRTLDVKADGVDEVLFEPFDVPDGDNVRLTLSAELGGARDELVTEVPIRPWGVQALASASGTSSDDTTVFVGLPAGRSYESPEMLITVAPTLRRMLIELALGQDVSTLFAGGPRSSRAYRNIFPPMPNTTADRASDLLAATSAFAYLRAVRAGAAPEASRLTDRIRGLVSELIALQNDDGGWPWVSGGGGGGGGRRNAANQRPRPSDRMTSARVVWALASAEPLGLLTDVKVLDQAAAHLEGEFARISGADRETRAAVLHALSTHRKATFEQANSLEPAERRGSPTPRSRTWP